MNIVEIVITASIIILAIILLYRSMRRRARGECECGSCSSHCPKYKNKE